MCKHILVLSLVSTDFEIYIIYWLPSRHPYTSINKLWEFFFKKKSCQVHNFGDKTFLSNF